jgi:hypothetical protein
MLYQHLFDFSAQSNQPRKQKGYINTTRKKKKKNVTPSTDQEM